MMIHKRKRGGGDGAWIPLRPTACGLEYVAFGRAALFWKNVTCKRCLKTRKSRKTRKD